MNNINKQRKQQRREKRQANDAIVKGSVYGQRADVINLSRFLLLPPSLIVKMRYNLHQQLNQPGFPYASYSWTCNGLYDVDPALASTAIPGFTEFMALYRVYQVISTKADVWVTNEGNNSCQVEFAWHNQFVAQNSYDSNKYGNAYSTQRTISAKGGQDRTHYVKTVDQCELSGTLAYWGSIANYQGTNSTNPNSVHNFVVSVRGGEPDCEAIGHLEFVVLLALPTILTV